MRVSAFGILEIVMRLTVDALHRNHAANCTRPSAAVIAYIVPWERMTNPAVAMTTAEEEAPRWNVLRTQQS